MPRSRPQLAKLTRPRLHAAVARERLFRLLDRVRETHTAACVVGPPGAGKTTLAASWLDARKLPGIWYQVDAGDGDLATFFYYLREAAQPFTRSGRHPLPLLTPEYLADVPGFARRFFRTLFDRLPVPSTLVLDNYQEVAPEQPFHSIVAEAVTEAPRGVTLIVISRRDPPDCYARLVANENVSLLDWDELKLTLPEAEAIAARSGKCDPDRVRTIHARADGWAAGVTLMLQRGSRSEASALGADTHQAVFDYFAEQIFARVPEETRRALMATCWLPSVTIAIGAEVTGNAGIAQILDDLYRRHLFVHRRAGDAPSYHYHALFRNFLQARAQQLMADAELRGIKLKAAQLLESAGDVESAVDLLIQVAEWAQAGRAIVAAAPRLIASGRWQTLQEWQQRLPAEEAASNPWLGYWLGRSRLGLAPAAARAELQRVLERFESRRDVLGQMLAVGGIVESHWVESSGHEALDGWIDRAVQLLQAGVTFPDVETELRVASVVMVAMSFRQPRHPMFASIIERMKALLEMDASDEAKLHAGSILIGQSLPGGDLALGQWTAEHIGPLAQRSSVSAVTRLMWLLRCACHYARDAQYERAWDTFREGETLFDREGLRAGAAMLCWWGGHIAILMGKPHEAERYAASLERGVGLDRPFPRGLLHNIRCMAALAEGRAEAALEHGRRSMAIWSEAGVVWGRVWYGVPTLYAMLETGDYAGARAEIASLRFFIAGTFVDVFEVELLLAEAYLAWQTGEPKSHHAPLRAALKLASDKQYVFLFRTSFRPHRLLLSEAFRAGLANDYLRSAVARFRLTPDVNADEHWPWPVKIFTLGRFEVRVADRALHFGHKAPRKPIGLLKALVAFGGDGVPEAMLLDALWPDLEADSARRALAMALHRLRALLGGHDTILVADGTLSLNFGNSWIDAIEVERLVVNGIAVPGSRDTPDLSELSDRVARLWRGPFLFQEQDAGWAVMARERLSARFVQFVAAVTGRLEAAGRWSEAAAWYQRGLASDNLAESFYQGLMRCYLNTGRCAEGLSAFRRMRQLLSIALGVAPSRESEALYRALQQTASATESVNDP